MCLWDILKRSSLPRLIFNWHTFSRWVTSRWWRQWAKNQVPTNEDSRNRWCHIVRHTICLTRLTRFSNQYYCTLSAKSVCTAWYLYRLIQCKHLLCFSWKMLNIFLQGDGLKFVYMMITSIAVETAFSWNLENEFSYWLQMRQHQ